MQGPVGGEPDGPAHRPPGGPGLSIHRRHPEREARALGPALAPGDGRAARAAPGAGRVGGSEAEGREGHAGLEEDRGAGLDRHRPRREVGRRARRTGPLPAVGVLL